MPALFALFGPLILPSFCITRILFIDMTRMTRMTRTARLQYKVKETNMITALQALFDISLAVAGAALTVAVFTTLVRLAAVVRQRAAVLLQRPQGSVRMQ
ncbi:hypothetical protein [Caballeronia sp. dw_19]|uniref:hypothetical protein n=3 Tax=unclassified Caballeronia TaxID=2646786 RepID=UPI001BD4A1A6|nr:hypothetical protein [Caballeronia sp. dw_19]